MGSFSSGLGSILGLNSINTNNLPAEYNPQTQAGLYQAPDQSGISGQIAGLQSNAQAIPGTVNTSASDATTQNQNALAQQLLGISNGTGPNPALLQQQQGLQAGLQQSRAAVQGSGAVNPIAALQAQQGAQGLSQRQTIGQGTVTAAQQQQSALSQLNQLYGQQQQTALGQEQIGLQAQQLAQQGLSTALQGSLSSAGMQEQANLDMAQATQNSQDQARQQAIQIAEQNQANQRAFIGSLLSGAATIGAGILTGGATTALQTALAAANAAVPSNSSSIQDPGNTQLPNVSLSYP